GQCTEDRIRVVSVINSRFGLHTDTVQQTTQLRCSAIAIQEQLLLKHDQIVKQATVDLRHKERQILSHLVVDLDTTGDLGQRVIDLIGGVMKLRLEATFSNSLERTFTQSLHVIGDRSGGQGAGAEPRSDGRAFTEALNHSLIDLRVQCATINTSVRIAGCLELLGAKRETLGRTLEVSQFSTERLDGMFADGLSLHSFFLLLLGHLHRTHSVKLRLSFVSLDDLLVKGLDLGDQTVDFFDLLRGEIHASGLSGFSDSTRLHGCGLAL